MQPTMFAIIPAAGHSVRMGTPKLLLPLAGKPLVLHAIEAWKRSIVEAIVVVVRAGDRALIDVVRNAGVALVEADPPPADMKASIQAALRHVERQYAPRGDAAFLVAPADMPHLAPAVIDRLIAEHARQGGRILVPTRAGRRGHPVLFPWNLEAKVHALGPEEGLDALVRGPAAVEIACDDLMAGTEQAFADIDTPEQYRQLADEHE
jgi:molybdenum cofactor cytidylyltransferase